MDMSPFVSADPATRADGWSPARKLRFLDRLAACGNVRAACAAVGMSRDAAYVLRRRDALFARGWTAARLLAREASVELLADMATEGIEEEVWVRGEMVGTRRRFDARLLLAHLARLDKMAEEAGEAAADCARFDEILAAIAGVAAPEELRDEVDALPIPREFAVDVAGEGAGEEVDRAQAELLAQDDAGSEDDDETGCLSDEDYAEYQRERAAAIAAARAQAGARWDAWFSGACRTVDTLLAEPAAPAPSSPATVPPGNVSDVSASPGPATFIGPNGNRYAHA